MDVLFCSVNDWANVGALFAKALRTVGVDAVSAVRRQHGWGYPDKSKIWKDVASLQALATQSKAVVMMHSELFAGLHLEGKRGGVFHGGSRYRRYKEKLNPRFNAVCDVTLVQTADLLNKGAKNPVWVMPPVDVEALKPQYWSLTDTLKYAHYPSNPRFKGSGAIKATAAKMGVDFRCSLSILPHAKHIDRMRKCDVYIERMALEREGKPTGVWGMSAMEAAALGKIVISNDLWRERYEKEFGDCPLIVANSRPELSMAILYLKGARRQDLEELRKQTREWVVAKHSFEPVGARLKEVLL